LFFSGFDLYSQSKILLGIVSDDAVFPLENANIIAKPLQEKAQLKFAITDNKGRYRLELETTVKYEVTVSYIGFIEEALVVEPNSDKEIHNFKLKATGIQLKEIAIKHDFSPIIVKKDTLVFDVKSFANGNERKMKEILEKLPGVEVDKNGGVTVQGKKVTKMLVEGKSFFGGGSKLAVENIPANALDKIEVIDHFNDVGFMKQVSDSEDLAMNVKLKEDKKKFVFGDVETGAEVANDNGFYLAHTALFYYSPKTNFSFIGDLNNVGKSTFTIQDLMRFQGGTSSYLTGRKSLSNLYSFTNDNTDVVKNKSQFAAFNFSFDASPKLAVSGFGIFSKVLMVSQSENKNEYLQNNTSTFEKKLQNNSNGSVLGMGNVKLDYSVSKNEKWYYNAQYQSSTNDLNNLINSVTNLNSSIFKTIGNADNSSVKQYVEWHKNYNEHHIATFVVNQAYEKSTPQNSWFTNQPFLSGVIPLQTDANYTIEQIKRMKNNSADALFKHYWTINNYNHIYTIIGNNFGHTNFETSEKQLLSNGTINDFASSGFGNNVKYQLNDAYVGMEYKFKIGKWINKPGLYLHKYHLNTNQNNLDFSITKTLFQPQWDSDYEFSQSESLNFSYKLTNNFPDVNQLANRLTLQSYNLVFKGNALLENESYHTTNLRYSKVNNYRGIMFNARINFIKKTKTIRNQIILIGINQYNTAILTDNPEQTYSFNGNISKKIYKFKLELNSRLSWLNYTQTLNTLTTVNDRNNQNIGLLFKTAFKKWPDFKIGYTKGYSHIAGLTQSNYQSDVINSAFEMTFFKYFTYKLEYENMKNTNSNNQTNFYEVSNTSLRYQKKNSPFGFELFANNLLDNKVKNNYYFSDYLISEQKTYVMPRVFMLSISYKL
jgi:ribosomal protein S6